MYAHVLLMGILNQLYGYMLGYFSASKTDVRSARFQIVDLGKETIPSCLLGYLAELHILTHYTSI